MKEQDPNNQLQVVFENGVALNKQNIYDIRKKITVERKLNENM